jgi:hypothetical protein
MTESIVAGPEKIFNNFEHLELAVATVSLKVVVIKDKDQGDSIRLSHHGLYIGGVCDANLSATIVAKAWTVDHNCIHVFRLRKLWHEGIGCLGVADRHDLLNKGV